MAIFFTSDCHFGHDRQFLWGPRGFESIQEHDTEVIRRWNENVSCNDTVYLLGDVMLNNNEHGIECMRQLNGNIHLIYGNHDTNNRKALYDKLPNVTSIGYSNVIKIDKFHFYLSHYPTFTSNLENDAPLSQHMINLYGHTHQKSNFYNDIPFMYHVGLDSHHCSPVSFETVIDNIRQEVQKCYSML